MATRRPVHRACAGNGCADRRRRGQRSASTLAPLSGLAGNGVILIGTSNGDILRVDPATGRTSPWLATDAVERLPAFTASGGTLLYSVFNPDEAIYAARPDGSDAHLVFAAEPGDKLEWVDPSPDGT